MRKTNSRCLTISRLIFENLCYSYLHRNDVTIQPHFIMFISYCIYLSFGMKSKWSFSWWNYDSQLWLHFATLAIQMVNNPRVVQMPGFLSVTARLQWCFKTLLSHFMKINLIYILRHWKTTPHKLLCPQKFVQIVHFYSYKRSSKLPNTIFVDLEKFVLREDHIERNGS